MPFLTGSRSISAVSTDGRDGLLLLLDNEISSDEEPSGSIHLRMGMISFMVSLSTMSDVTLIVSSFKGRGFIFVEVVAIRSETDTVGGVRIRWGDTKLCVTLNLWNESITRVDRGVAGGSFPPSKPVAGTMVNTNGVQFQN